MRELVRWLEWPHILEPKDPKHHVEDLHLHGQVSNVESKMTDEIDVKDVNVDYFLVYNIF